LLPLLAFYLRQWTFQDNKVAQMFWLGCLKSFFVKIKGLCVNDPQSYLARAVRNVGQTYDDVCLPEEPYVFLSTTKAHVAWAERMFDFIKLHYPEYTHWHMDMIPTGGNWEHHVIAAIRGCAFMIGICTEECKESNAKFGCPAEWEAARDLGKKVLLIAEASAFKVARENPRVYQFARRFQFLEYHWTTDMTKRLLSEVQDFLGPSCPIRIPQEVLTLYLDGDLDAFDYSAEQKLKEVVIEELRAELAIVRIEKYNVSQKNITARIGTRKCRLRVDIDGRSDASFSSSCDTDSSSNGTSVDHLEEHLKSAIQNKIESEVLPHCLDPELVEVRLKEAGSIVLVLLMPSPAVHVIHQLAEKCHLPLLQGELGLRCCKAAGSVVQLDERPDIQICVQSVHAAERKAQPQFTVLDGVGDLRTPLLQHEVSGPAGRARRSAMPADLSSGLAKPQNPDPDVASDERFVI